MLRIIGAVLIMTTIGCVPATKKHVEPAQIDLQDSIYRAIVNWQGEQNAERLLSNTNHSNPNYRLAVSNAFASVKSPNAIDSLLVLLDDNDNSIRRASAYALGQLGDDRAEKGLISSFVQRDTGSINTEFNATVLEAIGKCGSSKSLEQISSVVNYRNDDEWLLLGQIRAIYRFMLRSIVSSKGTEMAVKYATDPEYPRDVRLLAAHYLARVKGVDLEAYKFRITNILLKEKDAEIRMALATTCNKFDDNEVFESLKTQLEKETNDFVKCNLLRSLSKYSYGIAAPVFLTQLKSKNLEVSTLAADYFVNNGTRGEALTFAELARAENRAVVKSKLFKASLSHLPGFFVNTRTGLINEVKALFDETQNPYEKSDYLKALLGDVRNYASIKDLGTSSQFIPVKTAAFEGMKGILDNPKWNTFYGSYSQNRYVKRQLLGYIIEEFEKGDVALLSLGSNILKEETYDFKSLVKDTSFIKDARAKLNLPKQLEAYNDLTKAHNYLFENDQLEEYVSNAHKAIDWNLLTGISDSSMARIVTEKGNIEFRFDMSKSPESVANFIDLANKNYFDQKNFHRVVPNFVIQGGCSRGDGYSGMDYTISSELSQNYYDKPGVVGMASAGRNTESAQFFITHSPAPHLDGKYTIFGQVITGQDIVNQIRVGDLITDVQIIK